MSFYSDACESYDGWSPHYGLNVAADNLGSAYVATGASSEDAIVTKYNAQVRFFGRRVLVADIPSTVQPA